MRLIAFAVVVSSLSAWSAPTTKEELPPSLREWTGWVLHDEKEAGCPFLQGQDAKQCSWPGRLSLSLDDKGGAFSQGFKVYREAWLPLPGGVKRWPQGVQVDGKAAVVVTHGEDGKERPAVKLLPGEHTVTGAFLWDSLPEAVEIPPGTGLLELKVKGKAIALPNRDDDGRVYLQKETVTQESERLEITVHRVVTDEIPVELTTRVTLNVSGKSREVLLGRALLEGFVPMALSSGVPARLEADGRLRLQVRPGTWTVDLVARSEGQVTTLSRPEPNGPWVEGDEVWCFDARPSLRQVLVEGVNAVDPQQTTLPNEWKRFPAYAVDPKSVMTLTERRRGDSDPPADELHLVRKLWLDFEGTGYTVSDTITGQLHRSWRLDMQPRTELGRVVSAGADQSITRLTPTSPAGVELRQGGLTLEAESRIGGGIDELPAVSWDADFHSVEAELQLPPGWALWHASGADKVPETWVEQWTLLDIFLVLIIVVTIARLFGAQWGALALVTLVLTWQESDVPQYVWLAVLVGEALVRVLPEHWVRQALRLYRLAAWAALVIISVGFMVSHVRQGMYPALAQKWKQLGAVKSWSEYQSENAQQYQRSTLNIVPPIGSAGALEDEGKDFDSNIRREDPAKSSGLLRGKLAEPPSPPAQVAPGPRGGEVSKRSFNVKDYDRNAMVQTGPGLPRWDWNRVALQFSGPVQRSQELHFVLTGPKVNLILHFVRVLLLALLALCVLGFPGSFWPESWRRKEPDGQRASTPLSPNGGSTVHPEQSRRVPTFGRHFARLFALLLGATLALPARAQDTPDQEILDELKKRLLEKPECAPSCASLPRLAVEASPGTLRLRVEILSGAETAIPLPGHAKHWVPETVVVDGRPSSALWLSTNGTLWLAVSEGAHQVVLEGPLPSRDTVQIELPLKAQRVEARLDGWTLDGLHEDGVADESLQLSRKGKTEGQERSALQTGTLPPFVRVERDLVLGLTWTIETRVTRLTPTGSAVVLEVPLLAGESVTTSELRVANGKALVNLPPAATELAWSSVLETKSPIELTAPKGVAWVETWRLDVSPVWHVALSGIPVVHQQDASGVKLPEWRPWPGEAVHVEVVKPEGVQGQTLTIDQSSLKVSPGVRATDVQFTANLRASRGGLHTFTLPEGSELQSVTINGAQQPIRQEGKSVSIPLVPGSMNVELSWRQGDGITSSWQTPALGLGTNTVNAELHVTVPQERWVLLLAGPRMGPAVLFWSFLLVLLLVSIGLGRVKVTPLSALHWVLLAIGLSQLPIFAIAVVYGWLLLLGWREKRPSLSVGWFNLRQLFVVGVTAIALIIIGVAVYDGLLGAPQMQVEGNGSSTWSLRWFQDRTTADFPRAWVLTMPMLVYRFAMLFWSLWMATALLGWLKWGWRAFSTGGLWRSSPKPPPKTPAAGT